MFSANIAGQIKRVIHDNGKDGKDAILKIVVECRKQFVRDGDMPNIYPAVTIFGHDAAYVREYAGVGHWITLANCEMDVYRPEDADEDRISFKAGRINLLPKALSEAVGEVVGDGEEEEESPRRRKKSSGSKRAGASSRGKSERKPRSERRKRRDEEEDDWDDEDEEEEEAPRRKKRPSGKASDGARKKKPASKSRKRRDEEEDEDYDEDYDDEFEDEDDYFDDED